jgi:hypothetical protein
MVDCGEKRYSTLEQASSIVRRNGIPPLIGHRQLWRETVIDPQSRIVNCEEKQYATQIAHGQLWGETVFHP